ncbi:MAG: hypothetical protein AAF654_07520 [Myxococcota bacterium]
MLVLMLLLGAAVVGALLVLASTRHSTLLGNSHAGFRDPPEPTKLSPHEALKLASPYLETSYALRRRGRKEGAGQLDRPALDWLGYKRGYYLVTRDDYPSYSPGFYDRHAVRVNANTGDVEAPR